MPSSGHVFEVIKATLRLLFDLLSYGISRIWAFVNASSREKTLQTQLADARTFGEWYAVATLLDELQGNDIWRSNPISTHYDHRHLSSRLRSLVKARDTVSPLPLLSCVRAGFPRNLDNVTVPALYNRAYSGTKLLVEEYVVQVVDAVKYLAGASMKRALGVSAWDKARLLRQACSSVGRTALVLGVGGQSVVGMVQMLGMARALGQQRLLPSVIVGVGKAATVAALIAVTRDEEMEESGEGFEGLLVAFTQKLAEERRSDRKDVKRNLQQTLRGVIASTRDGAFESRTLREHALGHVADTTFAEAYARTNRVLNIPLAIPEADGVPVLLNYMTAPDVLIASAVTAAAAAVPSSIITLTSKDEDGRCCDTKVRTLPSFDPLHCLGLGSESDGLQRQMVETCGTNHYIIARSMPALLPALDEAHRSSTRLGRLWHPVRRSIVGKVQHYVRQAFALGVIPRSWFYLLLEESGAPGTVISISPALGVRGLLQIWKSDGLSSEEIVRTTFLDGERCVWPVVKALRVRCGIEYALEGAWRDIRRLEGADRNSHEHEVDGDISVRQGKNWYKHLDSGQSGGNDIADRWGGMQ